MITTADSLLIVSIYISLEMEWRSIVKRCNADVPPAFLPERRTAGRPARILFFLLLLTAFFATAESADLQLKNLRGEVQQLQDYRGKILVLNFWATWCVPCREEMPLFVRLQNRYASQGVQFIGASIDVPEDTQKVNEFAREYRINFPIWLEATLEQQASFALGTAVPATAIFDRESNLRFRIIGQSEASDLEKRIQYLLTGNGSQPDVLLLPKGMSKEHFEQHHARVSAEEHHDHGESHSGGSEVPS